MKTTILVGFRVDQETLSALNEIAQAADRSKSATLRVLIRSEFERIRNLHQPAHAGGQQQGALQEGGGSIERI
jgi:predicted transcriptional regulator